MFISLETRILIDIPFVLIHLLIGCWNHFIFFYDSEDCRQTVSCQLVNPILTSVVGTGLAYGTIIKCTTLVFFDSDIRISANIRDIKNNWNFMRTLCYLFPFFWMFIAVRLVSQCKEYPNENNTTYNQREVDAKTFASVIFYGILITVVASFRCVVYFILKVLAK